jgi:hypothetical protein
MYRRDRIRDGPRPHTAATQIDFAAAKPCVRRRYGLGSNSRSARIRLLCNTFRIDNERATHSADNHVLRDACLPAPPLTASPR